MTEEQRKWYLAGVADMEAGRLVTKPDGLDFAVAQVRDRDLVIESLREQLAEAEFWKQALVAAQERAVAAEAKLAEVEKERDEAEAALGEDVAVMFERGRRSANALREKLAAREASMDRARELAERQVPIARKEAEWTREATWSDAAIAFDQIARLLGGDDEPK